MAITIKLPYYTGETGVTASRYSEAGTLIQSGIAMTETSEPGVFSGSFTFASAGYQTVHLFSEGETEAFGRWAIAVTADNTTADYAESIGELRSRATVASYSTTGRVTVVNPVDNTGKVTGAIVIGDDYLAANSRAFSWTIPAISGVTAATATPWFGGKLDNDNAWLVDGTLTVDGSNWVLSFDLAKEDTLNLESGYYAWSVEVKSATGVEITRVRSDTNQVQLVEKQT